MAVLTKNISPINIILRSDEVVFGDVWYYPGGEFGPRIQQDYQLVIVHLGEAHVKFGDRACLISPGAVALMLPGRREFFRFSHHYRTHHTWCAVKPNAVPEPLRKRLAKLPPMMSQSQTFEFLMKAGFGVRSGQAKSGRRVLGLLGLALLEEYVRMAEVGEGKANRESPYERARLYLEEHCGEENCLKGAAQVAGVTPQHLIRLFHKQGQLTPGRFLWQARVERGAGLIAETGLTVAEIAHRCGFKNPFHFSRLLRKMQGLSPRQLRQRAWVKVPTSTRPRRWPASAENGAARFRV